MICSAPSRSKTLRKEIVFFVMRKYTDWKVLQFDLLCCRYCNYLKIDFSFPDPLNLPFDIYFEVK